MQQLLYFGECALPMSRADMVPADRARDIAVLGSVVDQKLLYLGLHKSQVSATIPAGFLGRRKPGCIACATVDPSPGSRNAHLVPAIKTVTITTFVPIPTRIPVSIRTLHGLCNNRPQCNLFQFSRSGSLSRSLKHTEAS